MKIEGKIAVITGGTSGIGKAVVQRLLENKIKFVTVIDVDEESGQELLKEFGPKFGEHRIKFINCDVTDEKRLRESFQAAFDVHKALDIVINNAGIISKDHHKNIAVNLIGVMNGLLIATDLLPKSDRSEKGVIVNTASIVALTFMNSSNTSYTASKCGVVGLTKSFTNTMDGFSKDLRAVAICPSVVRTQLGVRNNYVAPEDIPAVDKENEPWLVCMERVVDAFIQAIDDDNLNGALIAIEPDKTRVIERDD